MTKVCKKCGRELPISSFWRSSVTDDGLYWYCKECELRRCEMRRRQSGQRKRRKAKHKLTLKQQISALRQALSVARDALTLAERGQLDKALCKRVLAVAEEAIGNEAAQL